WRYIPNSSYPRNLTNVNGTLFFTAFNGSLWKSDGTAAGTVLVADLVCSSLTNVNGTLFFSGDDGTNGQELWKSDGTTTGTVTVKDIYPESHIEYDSYWGFPYAVPNSASPTTLTNVNGTLFFTAYDGTNGGLWKTDGTTANTVLVKSVGVSNLTNVNGTLLF